MNSTGDGSHLTGLEVLVHKVHLRSHLVGHFTKESIRVSYQIECSFYYGHRLIQLSMNLDNLVVNLS